VVMLSVALLETPPRVAEIVEVVWVLTPVVVTVNVPPDWPAGTVNVAATVA